MASWEPVKRLRVRLAVGLGVSKTKRSSEEEARLDDDAERKRLALIGAMKSHRRSGHITALYKTQAGRAAPPRDATRHALNETNKRGGDALQ
jgi:hypothetical protein